MDLENSLFQKTGQRTTSCDDAKKKSRSPLHPEGRKEQKSRKREALKENLAESETSSKLRLKKPKSRESFGDNEELAEFETSLDLSASSVKSSGDSVNASLSTLSSVGRRASPSKKIVCNGAEISDFRMKNVLLVDKSSFISKLASSTCKSFFACRPKKFGKTLFLGFLREFFLGNKAFFEGLAISADPSLTWEKYPVIHFDMTHVTGRDIAQIETTLKTMVLDVAREMEVAITNTEKLPPSALFRQLIKGAHGKEKKRVVILIDEYDYPVLSLVNNQEVALQCQSLLASFYAMMKMASSRGYLRFRYITGITRFCVYDFGNGLNELQDIDFDPEHNYTALFGYTVPEIEENCSAELEEIAHGWKVPFEAVLDDLKKHYNGFNWDKHGRPEYQVLNPYSVNCFLAKKAFDPYWGAGRGIPFWLKSAVAKYNYVALAVNLDAPQPSCPPSLTDLFDKDISSEVISHSLWECGLLSKTSKGGFFLTNKETVETFQKSILNRCKKPRRSNISSLVQSISENLARDDIVAVFSVLEKIFHSFPDVVRNKSRCHENEYPYHLTTYGILRMQSDIRVGPEGTAGAGRMDLWIATKSTFFIIEFKVNKSPEEAIQQIKEKQYYRWSEISVPGGEFFSHRKQAVGVNFETKSGGVRVKALVEDLDLSQLLETASE